MNKIKTILLTIIFILGAWPVRASLNLSQKLSGRILLQVESRGQAWYVNPADGKKYYLGRPTDAFEIMRRLSLGISQADFNKLSADKNLASIVKGRIILQVEARGQAWYVNPTDQEKYYLGRPSDAFEIMKRLAVGISDADLAQIPEGQLALKISVPYIPAPSQKSILTQAADSVRNNDSPKVESFFTPEMRKAISYTMTALSSESKLLLANILSSAVLENQTDEQKTYSAQAYFSLGGYNVTLKFHVKKQSDGIWLIANL